MRRADHPAVGLVLDSFHILARGTDLSAIRAIPGDRIFLVQLADAPLLQMDYLSWSRHFRNFPGQGELPVLDFMEALSATGYDGALSLEIFNDQFRAGSPRSVAVDGHRSLRFLLDQLGERTGKRAPNVPVLPPRPRPKAAPRHPMPAAAPSLPVRRAFSIPASPTTCRRPCGFTRSFSASATGRGPRSAFPVRGCTRDSRPCCTWWAGDRRRNCAPA